MSNSISNSRFEALKRQAKRLVRADSSLTHSQALDRIARGENFDNWSLLAASRTSDLKKSPAIATSGAPSLGAYTVTLWGCVLTIDPKDRWQTEETIQTRYPPARYEQFQWIHKHFGFRGARGQQASVLERIATAKRAIHFMDQTGLRPSRAWARIVGSDLRTPYGFDHTSVWRDEQDRFILTTEPYIGSDREMEVAATCDARGWKWILLPNGRGIWNPCRDGCKADCSGHTRMYVVAPSKNGGDPEAIARQYG